MACFSLQSRARGGRGDADLVEHEPVVGRRNKFDVACLAAEFVHLDKGQTEARDAQKRARQWAIVLKLSTNHRSACCT